MNKYISLSEETANILGKITPNRASNLPIELKKGENYGSVEGKFFADKDDFNIHEGKLGFALQNRVKDKAELNQHGIVAGVDNGAIDFVGELPFEMDMRGLVVNGGQLSVMLDSLNSSFQKDEFMVRRTGSTRARLDMFAFHVNTSTGVITSEGGVGFGKKVAANTDKPTYDTSFSVEAQLD